MELCRLQNWCLPCYYSFCFPGQNRSGSSGIMPVISSMTAGSSSTKLLKSMLDITEQYELPKTLLLRNETTGQVSYLPQSLLTPVKVFNFYEKNDCFLVSKSSLQEDSDNCDISDTEENMFTDPEENGSDNVNVSSEGENAEGDMNNNCDYQDPVGHVRHLLPNDFDSGFDGMGSCSKQHMKQSSFFRRPWLFNDEQTQTLIRVSKMEFFEIVKTSAGSRKRAGDLNHFAHCFLFLYKLCHNPSFHQIRVLFGLSSSNLASRTFYFQLIHQFLNNCNIPMVIYINDVNEEEVENSCGLHI